jgi:6-phosphogluconolactonase
MVRSREALLRVRSALRSAVIAAVVLPVLACGQSGTSSPGLGGASGAQGGTGAALGGSAGSGGVTARGGSGGASAGNGEGGRGVPLAGQAGTGLGGSPAQGGSAGADSGDSPKAAFVYVGSYANQILVFSMDQETGALTPVGNPVQSNPSPSFLAFGPSGNFLFAVNEADDVDGNGAGAVSAFRIDPSTGGLSFLNRVSSEGAGPAHVAVEASGKFVFVANYNGGTVAVLPVRTDGTLGAAVDTVSHGGGAQSHQVVVAPSNQFVFVPNKGLSAVSQYRFDAQDGSITPNTPPSVALPAGAGSRHMAFHPTLAYAYLINELDDSVAVFSYDPTTGLLGSPPIQTLSTLPAGAAGGNNATAEIQVAPSGNFVYGSNRGNNSIVIYSVAPASGRLTLVGHQPTGGSDPRSFNLDATGKILLCANQNSNEVVTFGVDTVTGLLSERTSVTVSQPAFVGVSYQPLP